MPIQIPKRTTPKRFIDVVDDVSLSICLQPYDTILEALEVTIQIAASRMIQLYESAVTNYDPEYIPTIFELNLYANQKKYEEFISLFESDVDIFSPVDLAETYTDTRRPNLTSSSSSTGSGTATQQNNQTRSLVTTPLTTSTRVHSVSPYDGSGSREESRDVVTDGGSTSTQESYAGNADQTTTSSTATSTVTSTGSETYEHSLRRIGRDGKFKISEIIDDAELSAAKLNFLDIILQDIADQLFLQVWI